MGLLSYFKRHAEPPTDAPAAAEPDAVAAARTRARRRLIGASVLLGIGVIGFPLLFETQPRPIAVNIPIEIPRKDGLPPLVMPAAPALSAASAVVLDETTVPPATATPDRPAAATTAAAAPAEIVERAADQGKDLVVPAATPTTTAVAPKVTPAPLPAAPVAVLAAKPPPAASKPAASKPDAAKPADDGMRARALLDGDAAASAPVSRVVVQVGAYADPAKLGDARQKLEKLGLKTYTQVVEVDGAKRTRVRVGPFASRADADKAAARIKAAGLPVAILTL